MKKFSRILVTILLISNLLPSVAMAEEISQSSSMESVSSEFSATEKSDVTESTKPSSSSLESSSDKKQQETDSTTSESQIETSETKEVKLSRAISPRITYDQLDGAKEPDDDGIRFIIPLRVGFITQPQKEQYIRKGKGNYADLAVQTTSTALLETTKGYVEGWKYNTETTKWDKYKSYGPFKSALSFATSKQSIAIAIDDLEEGTYYFQVHADLNTGLGTGIFHRDFYSEFAKVIVLPEHVAANNVSVEAPEVMYEKAEYSASVNTEPYDTTSTISWDSDFVSDNISDKFVYFPPTGRNTGLSIDEPSTVLSNTVNTNVNTPGFPVNIKATALNNNGSTAVGVKQAYYGGLAAKETPPDVPFNWNLNDVGLKELQSVSTEVKRWEYRWLYYEKNSNNPKEIDGATGSVTNLTELSSIDNGLKKSPDSAFFAAAKLASDKDEHFAVQVELKAIIKDGWFNKESQIIMSNKAELRIIPNELRLRKVPNLDFGQLPMNYIYEGTGENKIDSQNSGILEVRDTQKPSGGWTLNAKMTTFENSNKVKLEENTTSIQLESLSANTTLNKNLTATNGLVPLLSSNKSEQLYLKGGLGLGANPTAIINKDDIFTSQITWNLVSGSVRAKALE